jgi:nitrous oxidase accessory protein NosD
VEYASRFGGNLIVNNGGWGVAVRGTQPDATPGLVVMANRIGITKDGADAGNIKGGIWLGGSVADAVKDASIAFWGTFKDANDAHNWNVISFNKGPGVMLAPGCQGAAIQGNVLERNHKEGLLLAGSRNCDVVGNQICRNQLSGVRIEGGSGHRLWANSVGKRDATDSGNLGCGVEVTGGGTDISVGMEDVRGLFGNYIGRNTLQGIAVVGAGGKVLIQGNEVSANGGDGVWVEDSPGVRVGTQPTDQVEYASRFGGNLIVNNGGWGVAVRGTRPDATPGLVVMANRIGGTAEGAGNAKGGVWLGGSVADAVKGAWIAFQGTFKDANDAHNWNAISFNKGPGVMLASGSRGTVVRGNRLAHNQGAGVVVEGQDSRGHSLLANRIWDHERWPGIDLGGDLVTKNDDLDTDDGPNGLQNFPVLEAAQTKADWGTFFRGRLKSAPNGEFLLQFFANTASVGGYFAGEDFLGQQTVRTDAAGNASFVFGTLRTDLGYLWITATATDKDGNTSEFSGGVKVETASDGDSDGVADLLENGAPNNGDGNRDGVPDGQQANVVSYQVIEPGGADAFLTLASAPNTTLKARVQAPTPAGLPSGVRCPLGLQQVEVKCAAGSDQCIETILPAGTQYSTFYRYGPTADDSQPHWYEFKYDGATGAFLQYGRVKQWIRDGGRGDDDGTANGVISCTGGVATDSSVLNAAPGVARIQDRTVEEGGTLGPIRCEIGDPDTPETDCQVTARCESLIPNDNITVGGSGTERDLTLRSVLGQTGTTTVTVGVSDGTSTVTTSYRVTVTARPGSLYTTVEPSAAAADGCKAEPAQAERPVGSKVAVSATEAGAWNFLLWTGAASGFEPTTDVTVTGLGMEAVAHFVKPVLTLGAGGLPQHYCPQSPDLAQDVQVMNLTLSVNEEAAWLVTSIRFQGSGANGHEVNDLEAVKLYKGGTLLSQGTYGADDGFIELGVNQQVPPGGSLNLQLKYQFRENTLTNPPWAKQFAVQTKVDWVNAKPDLPPYPNYAKLPPTLFSVPAVLIAPVWNLNTGEGFGTIQRAIDDPDTANGHTLEVCPGLYVENVRVNKELAIKSKVGPSRTIVQAADTNQDVFSVSANNVIIEGFTIRGADGIDSLGPTAGVDVSGARDFALRKCVVEANAVGAALHWSERCIIADNALRANLFDGLWIAEGKSILVHGNEMAGDGASDQGNQGCGIRVEGGREVYVGYERVDRSILSQNTIKGNRLWGIAVLGSELAPAMEVFIGCNAISNNGRDGVWIEEASQVTVGDARTSCGNLIVGNGRDGVYINASSTVSVLGNRIGEDASGAAPNKGAGVSVADSSDVKVGGPAATPGKEPGNVIVNNEKGGIVIWARTEGKSARNTVEGNLGGYS